MDTAPALSVNDIYQAITALDPKAAYRHISYNLTQRNALSTSAPWWVFISFGAWNSPLTAPNPSPLEKAILQALPSGPSNECFIDIMHLDNAKKDFFDDPNASEKIGDKLAAFINQLPEDVTPIIRYIVGHPGKSDPTQDGLIQTLFSGKITHKQACVYFGNFTPGFQLAPTGLAAAHPQAQAINGLLDTAISRIWDWLLAEIKGYSLEVYQVFQHIESEIVGWMRRFVQLLVLTPVSWNHAKIFAVNGTSLVTGGANYWSEYATTSAWLFDMALSITGDAASDGHQFANYFWQYLSNIPPTDTTSWSKGNLLTNPISAFTDAKAPLYTNVSHSTGSLAALSVGKNGNWPAQDPGFPAQIFDALRDFVLNVLAAVVDAHASHNVELMPFVTKTLSDDNPEFLAILSRANISPAAWASRYARNYAVSQAQKSLRFGQQKFVLDDLVAVHDPGYQQLVDEINRYTGSSWDGFLWPFDMLMALSHALSNMSHTATGATGVEIVCSYLAPGQEGYQDATSAQDFADKLTEIMSGMQQLGYIQPAGPIPDLIQKLLAYRRISTLDQSYASHSKLVIVDDAVCYIGSDNAYPSYNQEFGIWIDDPTSIQAFISQYWDHLWAAVEEQS